MRPLRRSSYWEIMERKQAGRPQSWRPYAKYARDFQKLREEKTKMEGMVKSRDELIMEFTDKYGYNCSNEDADDEDDDDGGDAAAPLQLLLRHPLHPCHLLLPLR
jgi:hypothetical protein